MSMHTDTTEKRTLFLATPQYGFAHLNAGLTHVEPLHDFLVVQFGAVAEAVAASAQRIGWGGRRHCAEERP